MKWKDADRCQFTFWRETADFRFISHCSRHTLGNWKMQCGNRCSVYCSSYCTMLYWIWFGCGWDWKGSHVKIYHSNFKLKNCIECWKMKLMLLCITLTTFDIFHNSLWIMSASWSWQMYNKVWQVVKKLWKFANTNSPLKMTFSGFQQVAWFLKSNKCPRTSYHDMMAVSFLATCCFTVCEQCKMSVLCWSIWVLVEDHMLFYTVLNYWSSQSKHKKKHKIKLILG